LQGAKDRIASTISSVQPEMIERGAA